MKWTTIASLVPDGARLRKLALALFVGGSLCIGSSACVVGEDIDDENIDIAEFDTSVGDAEHDVPSDDPAELERPDDPVGHNNHHGVLLSEEQKSEPDPLPWAGHNDE